MNIFSGIEILFFCLGVLTTLSVGALVYLSKRYHLDWKSRTMSGGGVFFLIFCVAWSVSSVLEGEPQAAALGLVFFGSPAIILFLLIRRIIVAGKKNQSD